MTHRALGLVFILATLGCSARATPPVAPSRDAGSDGARPADGGPEADGGDANVDARTPECAPGTTFCRSGEVATCGPDGRVASMTPCAPGEACAGDRCVDACDVGALGSTYQGCNFRGTAPPALMSGHGGPRIPMLGFGFHNPGASPSEVEISGGTLAAPVTTTVGPDSSAFVTVPLLSGVFDRAVYGVSATVLARDTASYRIHATQPIAVYQFSPDYGLVLSEARFLMKSDATMLLPTHAWGLEYVVATMAPSCAAPPCGPEEMTFLQVTADTDATLIEVVADVPIEASVEGVVSSSEVTETPVAAIAAGATARFTLDAGDVLQLASGYDLAGAKLMASAPVQVLSGNVGVRDPLAYHPLGDGHLHEALLPLRSWGTSYVVAPPPHPTRDEALPFTVRVLAGATGATVTFDPPSVSGPITLAPNGHADLVGLAVPFRVDGDRPFLALGQSSASDVPTGDELGQPYGAASMVAFPPIDQWRTSYGLSVPTEFDYGHVTVIYPSSATVEIDGVPLTGGLAIGATGLSTRTLVLDRTTSAHRATGTQGFAMLVYGQAAGSSYWYTAGLDAQQLY